jgi:hypothetical protein
MGQRLACFPTSAARWPVPATTYPIRDRGTGGPKPVVDHVRR